MLAFGSFFKRKSLETNAKSKGLTAKIAGDAVYAAGAMGSSIRNKVPGFRKKKADGNVEELGAKELTEEEKKWAEELVNKLMSKLLFIPVSWDHGRGHRDPLEWKMFYTDNMLFFHGADDGDHKTAKLMLI